MDLVAATVRERVRADRWDHLILLTQDGGVAWSRFVAR